MKKAGSGTLVICHVLRLCVSFSPDFHVLTVTRDNNHIGTVTFGYEDDKKLYTSTFMFFAISCHTAIDASCSFASIHTCSFYDVCFAPPNLDGQFVDRGIAIVVQDP